MRKLVAMALGITGLAGPLMAATLFTAPLPGGGAGVYCQAVNVTTAPRDVSLPIFAAGGQVVNTLTCSALPTQNSCTLAVPGAFTAPHTCRIDVVGAKTTVRGSLVRLTSEGVPAVALPAQ